MKAQEWRQALGECVRDFFRKPEMAHFYSVSYTHLTLPTIYSV